VFDTVAYYKNRFANFSENNSIIQDTIENLTTCLAALEDLSSSMRYVEEGITIDDERLTEVESRIKLIFDLKTKYRKDIPQILGYLDEMKNFIAGFEKNVSQEEDLNKEIQTLRQMAFDLASSLSDKRIEKSKGYENAIMEYLRQLLINDAEFKIIIDKNHDPNNHGTLDVNAYNHTGFDRVKYVFSANKGTVLQDLKSTISGGELSRLLLVIKTLLAKKLPERTVIFDEIDSGIGGKTANQLGCFIKGLSSNHQILCISHLPQVASFADHHLKIEKISDSTKSMITFKELNHRERKEEIARMLSGNITTTALEHAEELLESNRRSF
jgi:DNA repair protein RecN (Recombination protein N)